VPAGLVAATRQEATPLPARWLRIAASRSAERLAAIRTHLAGKGVASWRVAAASPAGNDQVLLRLVAPAGGVKRLDDSSLPPPPPPPSAARASAAASGAVR
jgi:hypothetical protein